MTLAAAASLRTQAGMNGKLKEKPALKKSKNESKTSKPTSAGKAKETNKDNSKQASNKDISKQANNDKPKQANNKSKACTLQ